MKNFRKTIAIIVLAVVLCTLPGEGLGDIFSWVVETAPVAEAVYVGKGNNVFIVDPSAYVYHPAKFNDLSNHKWAEKAIMDLAHAGIVKGTSNTTYSPAANITRADFVLYMVNAFKFKGYNKSEFKDINGNEYYAEAVAIAADRGIVNGVSTYAFAPNNAIKRCDMMVIIHRALKAYGINLKVGSVSMPDMNTVPAYAQEAVKALIGAELVNGKSGKVEPNAYVTRAEVAALISRLVYNGIPAKALA